MRDRLENGGETAPHTTDNSDSDDDLPFNTMRNSYRLCNIFDHYSDGSGFVLPNSGVIRPDQGEDWSSVHEADECEGSHVGSTNAQTYQAGNTTIIIHKAISDSPENKTATNHANDQGFIIRNLLCHTSSYKSSTL